MLKNCKDNPVTIKLSTFFCLRTKTELSRIETMDQVDDMNIVAREYESNYGDSTHLNM